MNTWQCNRTTTLQSFHNLVPSSQSALTSSLRACALMGPGPACSIWQTAQQHGETGTRMASVWFKQVDGINYLHVCTDIAGKQHQYYQPESSIEVGKKISIRIAQNLFGEHYEFSISVNCMLVWAEVNPSPKVIPNINLYAGNADFLVQEGVMTNLEVKSN